jgi:hypothetical protein
MREKIKTDKEMISRLTKAQLKWAADMMLDDHWQYSDDGWDYCQGAVGLAHTMLHISYDQDTERLEGLLNNKPEDNPEDSLGYVPCDGVCPAFYELKPIALDDGADDE